jgi:mannose-6-phosphate isomerase-like protein (cupin superfamily)
MEKMERRSFLAAAIAALPVALIGQSSNTPATTKPVRVVDGEDRLGEHHTIGISSTAFKVLTRDTGGDLFIIQHANLKKGGPPRHVHHNEDEWFYVLEGNYIAEIGAERFELKAGDSVLGPRGVPHAWAFVGEGPGKLLIAFAPANKMEAFFRDNEKRRKDGDYVNDAAVYKAYGLELLGPPLSVG